MIEYKMQLITTMTMIIMMTVSLHITLFCFRYKNDCIKSLIIMMITMLIMTVYLHIMSGEDDFGSSLHSTQMIMILLCVE
jgi:hypothetical protein